ncbi:MAG: HAD family hydrolase [Chloroflexi bacterium]|nr:MAG: HAD family hydrolase [Chloroflexota bacterium]
MDRGQHLIGVESSVRSPSGPSCADEAHGVDQDPVQVEHDRPRVKVAQLRGVIFDLDGVLAVSEALLAEAAIALFAEKGLQMTADDFKPFIGMGEDRYIGGAAETRGVELDLARDKARLYEIYGSVIRGRLEPLPGAVEFVNRCKRRGLAVAVASGADRVKVFANLREIGLPETVFATVVDGNQVVRKKPAPDIFLEAARRIGLPPASCLVVEDAVSGVAAARAAGMRCLGITSTFSPAELAGADWLAPDLADVPDAALGW